MHKLATSYTNYFNKRHKRSGSLFQGKFKSKELKTTGLLIKLSCYINMNSEIHKISKAIKWRYSSYLDYISKRKGSLCQKQIIMNEFTDINEYIELACKEIKTLVIE